MCSSLLAANAHIILWCTKSFICAESATKFLFLMSAGTFMQAKDSHFVLHPIVHLCCWLSGARVERCEFLSVRNLKSSLQKMRQFNSVVASRACGTGWLLRALLRSKKFRHLWSLIEGIGTFEGFQAKHMDHMKRGLAIADWGKHTLHTARVRRWNLKLSSFQLARRRRS